MLRKSLIQFSVDGCGCVPSLLFTWVQTMVGVMKIMATPSKVSHADTTTLSAPDPAACQHHPRLHRRLLDIHGQVWVSLLWGDSLLGPGAHKVLFVPCKSLRPQFCVSSDSSMVGLTATSSKRARAMPRSAAPRALPLQKSTADPALLRRHTRFCLSLCGSLGPGVHKIRVDRNPVGWGVSHG